MQSMKAVTPSPQQQDDYPIRRSPCSWSEWSDPREAPLRKTVDITCPFASVSIQHRVNGAPVDHDSRGIQVPLFLQPLLGLDFVPYLPKDVQGGEVTDDDDSDEEKSDLMTPQSESTEHPDESQMKDLDLEKGLEYPLTASSQGKLEKRKGISSVISASLKAIKKGKRRGRRGSRSLSFHEDVTPRRSHRTRKSMSDVDWIHAEHAKLEEHQHRLTEVQSQSQEVQKRAADIESSVSRIKSEARQLQLALEKSLLRLEEEVTSLHKTRHELSRLEDEAEFVARQMEDSLATLRERRFEISPKALPFDERPSEAAQHSSITEDMVARSKPLSTPLSASSSHEPSTVPDSHRRRANTEPKLRRSPSSFMRVGDLELEGELKTSSSLSTLSTHSVDSRPDEQKFTNEDFFFIDENIGLILDKLAQLGYAVSTDESERFIPTGDTQRILTNESYQTNETIEGWPVNPWQTPKEDDILLWTGSVPHKGFGHDWPVIKARGIVRTSPLQLLDLLLDSSRIKTYNKMSQGREDIFVLQEGVDTTVEESNYSFPGEAKIMRALHKPKLLLKTVEVLSLCYAKHLENAPGSYMIVSRSVWEDETGTPKLSGMLRSEMLLGVQLLRPCPEGCELTTITHVYSPGVPEMLAKRMAPGVAANLIRDIQALFHS